MPVKINQDPECGACGRKKTATNRWFLLRVSGSELAYRDFNPELLSEYDEAICGMECLDKRHHAHARQLVGMRAPGEEPR